MRTQDGGWLATITYKVIKDIGRQHERTGHWGWRRKQQGRQVGECDIYIVIKSREQVGPLG